MVVDAVRGISEGRLKDSVVRALEKLRLVEEVDRVRPSKAWFGADLAMPVSAAVGAGLFFALLGRGTWQVAVGCGLGVLLGKILLGRREQVGKATEQARERGGPGQG